MVDQQAQKWKVILPHGSQSRRSVSAIVCNVLGAAGSRIDSEGMVSGDNNSPLHSEVHNAVNDLEIPFQHVEAPNASMSVPVEVDAIFEDDQYEDDPIFLNDRT